MATPSAKDMLGQIKRYAEGGDVQHVMPIPMSAGLTSALGSGLTPDQFYANIRDYASKNTNQLEALNTMSQYGISMADVNAALGATAVKDYFTVDPNAGEKAPGSVQTDFTSGLQQEVANNPNLDQAGLDSRIKATVAQYSGNPDKLRELFVQNQTSIADLQRAGVDPSVLYSTRAVTTPVTTPDTIGKNTGITTAPPVYKPLPEPPPIYKPGEPALDVDFRNSPPRTYDDTYGYMYTPAAKLLSATGSGMSFTPPSVTSRPRSLLNIPLATTANPQLSASQQFARDAPQRAAAQLAAMPATGSRFTGTAPASQSGELRFFTPAALTGPGFDEYGNPVQEMQEGGAVKKTGGTADSSVRTVDLIAQLDRIAATPNAKTPSPTSALIAQMDRIAATPNAKTPAPDKRQTESAGMLDKMFSFYEENISKPMVGSVIDMTLGLGDLGQWGVKYLANRAGIETEPFAPTAQRMKEAAGVADYNPYAIGALATNILPFAGAPKFTAAGTTLFPNLVREAASYAGSELGAAAAREVLPDSTGAELLASFIGSAAAGGNPMSVRNRDTAIANISDDIGMTGRQVSERVPTSVKFEGDSTNPNLTIGVDVIRQTPDTMRKQADVIAQYPNYPLSAATDSESVFKTMEDQITENLLFLHDKMPEDVRRGSMQWYDGANRIASVSATKYGLPIEATAGVYASLSPQMDWYKNVSLGDRVLDIMSNKKDISFTPGMERKATQLIESPKGGFNSQTAKVVGTLQGKRLSDLDNPLEKAIWLRLYDEAHNPREYNIVNPIGDVVGLSKTAKGKNAKVGWGSLREIAKAISIFENPSIENISSRLGEQHKVRSFYNNIVDPNRGRSVTSDTHNVAAGLLRPLSGTSTEVMDNLGAASSSSLTGVQGTYGLYADAVRKAADERSVQPRQMQSITWEGVRGLYSPALKRNKNAQAQVAQVFNEYKKGKINANQMREFVFEIGGGMDVPTWYGK